MTHLYEMLQSPWTAFPCMQTLMSKQRFSAVRYRRSQDSTIHVSSTFFSLYSIECILRRLNYSQGDTIGYISPTTTTNEQYFVPHLLYCALLYCTIHGCASFFCSNRDKITRLCETIWRESFVLPLLPRGWILERNWDKSLKSFPPCYSQSSSLTEQKWFETGL